MAIKLDNKHAKSYFRAGKACFELRKYKDAEKYFSEGKYVSKLEIKDKTVQALLKEFDKWIAKSEEAKKAQNDRKPGQRVIKGLPGGANITSDLPSNLNQQQLIEEYQRKIEQIKQKFSEGKLKETKLICEEILSVVPGEKLSSHYLSTILNSARNWKKSVPVLEKAVKEHDKEFELKFSLGEAYYGNGDYSKSLDVFKSLFDLLPPVDSSSSPHSNPDYVRLSIRVVRSLIQLNQYDIALSLVTDLLKNNDTNRSLLLSFHFLFFLFLFSFFFLSPSPLLLTPPFSFLPPPSFLLSLPPFSFPFFFPPSFLPFPSPSLILVILYLSTPFSF